MNKFSEKISHLNPFSTKNVAFLEVWLKKYYIEKESKLMSEKMDPFICFYFILMIIRSTIALIYRSDNVLGKRMSVYLGSWPAVIGGPPHYFEITALLWHIQCVGCYFTILSKPKAQFLWFELFGAINGYINHNTIGIDDKMLKRLEIMVKLIIK